MDASYVIAAAPSSFPHRAGGAEGARCSLHSRSRARDDAERVRSLDPGFRHTEVASAAQAGSLPLEGRELLKRVKAPDRTRWAAPHRSVRGRVRGEGRHTECRDRECARRWRS